MCMLGQASCSLTFGSACELVHQRDWCTNVIVLDARVPMACMYAAVFTSEWMDLQLHVRYADLCTTWCYSVDIYLPCRTSSHMRTCMTLSRPAGEHVLQATDVTTAALRCVEKIHVFADARRQMREGR